MAKSEKPKNSFGRGPLSNKLIASFQKFSQKKIINLSEYREGKIHAENFLKELASYKSSSSDPLHRLYVEMHNLLTGFIEQISEFPGLSKLTDPYVRAEDEYLPSGPPMSPLTRSYFSCWGFYDLCAGPKRETLASVAIDVCRFLNLDENILHIFEKLEASRMGFYVHEGHSGQYIFLRELVTNEKVKAVVPSGYKGAKGEIVFARVLPVPFDRIAIDYSVVFTTPYLIGELNEKNELAPAQEINWLLFFERNLKSKDERSKKSEYEFFMKYGLSQNYWNEYIFLSYIHHKTEVILLTGIPDIPSSLPHSEEGRDKFGF